MIVLTQVSANILEITKRYFCKTIRDGPPYLIQESESNTKGEHPLARCFNLPNHCFFHNTKSWESGSKRKHLSPQTPHCNIS